MATLYLKICLQIMHKSLKSALPALRPVSPANFDSPPRETVSKSIVAGNPRFSSDFEVNRSLFSQDSKPKIIPPTKPKNAPRTVSQSAEKAKEKLQNSPNTQEIKTEQTDPQLEQITELFERIPNGKEPVPIDEVYKLSPILDRVLCVVTEMKQDFIARNINNPIIVELQQRLFNLIDIDDFLLRTIICRILLSFATDASSPLLLPISRIFYKLSCDQTNDHFFEEEQLIPVLISLVRIAQPDARVFAAGALRNISASEEIRLAITKSEFLKLALEIFSNDSTDQPLRTQILGSIKLMCKNDDFRKKLAETKFLSLAIKDKNQQIDVGRIISLVPEITKEEKLNLIKLISNIDIKDSQTKRVITRTLIVLSTDMVNTTECTTFVLKLLLIAKDEPELLYFLLVIAEHCAETEKNANILEKKADFFVSILKSQEFDTNICLTAYNIVALLKNDKYKNLLAEYHLLKEINQK